MSASLTTDAAYPPEPDRSRAEQRALDVMELERKQEAEEKTAVWAFIWTLFVFKIATMILIVYLAAGSSESLGVAFATTWYWFIIPIAAITGPLLYRWRLLRQRRKRAALRDAEWMTDTPAKPGRTSPSGGISSPQVTIVIHRPDDPPSLRG
jgi:hypothetical protein